MALKARLTALVPTLGVVPAAALDVVNRGLVHFGTGEPTQAELDAWYTTLRTECPHFWPTAPEIPSWLPATERLTRFRTAGGVPVQANSATPPQEIIPPADVVRQWEKLSPIARLQAFRAWQQAQRQ